ncbi:DegT/DnrJ/EryC1/StrS family aminotransferase [Pseudomonas sp. 10C3]|uniref:DegT/DnrJ/EryC1/StrS family aminotransferase n=1 Tax=Pseudomonas sp. 10C3 TaxID=3118753 RepID=UPI002E8113DF|nr:DegT/DnrJ/EryC1/StrS family aminotransferase [Pseudomonas sp. 10C3]MEE3508678.1 DegT/DnrJ/EryC1/StrS family aminotransferase [Pseudomonas sp. 10C3]
MKVSKQSTDTNTYNRSWFDYPRARDAFEAYLLSLNLSGADHIVIPNYIGYSTREGSGVFDPVVSSGVNYKFYELDKNIEIDVLSVENLIRLGGVKLVVIIHYFGYVDPSYKKIIKLARDHNIKVLEDQAHSLFTDLNSGTTGRLCDASIYSLHKMFPIETGGALSLTHSNVKSDSNNVSKLCLDHDISKISSIRIRNFNFLISKLSGHDDVLSIIRKSLDDGAVPQTFPILINSKNRDEIYHLMNAQGFGVVSLYHTMINEIADNKAFEINETAKKILNLPLHQDASDEALAEMCDYLLNILYAE